MIESVLDKQALLNRSTGGQWNLYASHRQALERLIVPAAPGGRICVLGAGNCNDLDLPWLLDAYAQVTLVDIDGGALTRGARFQKVENSPRLRLAGSIDLTGLADRLGAWSKKFSDAEEVDACIHLAAQPTEKLAAELGGPFDVVLSPCVLSQLLTPLRDTIKEAHRGFSPLLAAMRARHLRSMTDLLRAGGRGVFACDLFSSKILPDLARVPADQLPALMAKMIAGRKFFSGLDPASVAGALKCDSSIAPLIGKIRTATPWLWHMGLSKTYLVYAVSFEVRKIAPSGMIVPRV
ncbi:MAG TPA: hypothetical protein VG326_07250 [Tepidisphaeraceae bacterium]|jgi:hypothetical protein|nr:hypothetical protein [Tepidisphaeraceae bacterium]